MFFFFCCFFGSFDEIVRGGEEVMVAEAEVACRQSVPALEVPYLAAPRASAIEELVAVSSPLSHPAVERVRASEAAAAAAADVPASQVVSGSFFCKGSVRCELIDSGFDDLPEDVLVLG